MVIKYFAAAAELILLAMVLVSMPHLNIGNISGILICSLLLFVTLRFDKIKKLCSTGGGKAAVIAVLLLCTVSLVFAGFCSVKMIAAMNRDNDSPSAVVVLGCQVIGERPSKMLRFRLDKAIGYLNSHPDIPVIVSGGKGDDEGISEAQCMRNYLVENGISDDRITMEDKSSSTEENLENSFAILDEMKLPRSIVLITDGYHQYRAQLIAEKKGADKIGAESASTELRFIPTYWVREWFALFQQLFLK